MFLEIYFLHFRKFPFVFFLKQERNDFTQLFTALHFHTNILAFKFTYFKGEREGLYGRSSLQEG